MEYDKNGYDATYDGEWQNGKRCGKGHYRQVSRGVRRYVDEYKGEWLDDKEHGYGTSYSSEEKGVHLSTVTTTYKGDFREGKRHGHGLLIMDNFDGSFRNGKNYIEGEFVDGGLIGHAVCEYANGDTFEGEFKGGKNGHGVYTFANGQKFEGEWENDRIDIESVKSDPSLNTPMLLITEHHSGFDYNYTGTFLMVAEVGEKHYEDAMLIKSMTPAILGMVIERASGKSYAEYLSEKVWQPLGMNSAALVIIDSKKHDMAHTFGGVTMNIMDLAKIGRLYLNKGMWDGKRIVSEDWIVNSTRYDVTNFGYHYNWYNLSYNNYYLTRYPGYFALGIFQQTLYVNPRKNLIIVRLGSSNRGYAYIPALFERVANAWR